RDTGTLVVVERTDSTDWVLTCNGKRYDVVTDIGGHVLSASLPDFGVVIERRVGFTPAAYPLCPADAAAPGAPYRAEEVRIPAPQGHVLAGTLTVPEGPGPFPAAVLITGLSPNNRNNGEPPWMPLRDIADALSRHGVVVLRVDDRGIGASTGDHAPSTTFDEADDVRTEVGWLRSRPLVDRRRVALVGYSEGGLIAPMVAAGDSALAGIVTLAGPGVSGPEVARYQITAAVDRDSSIAPGARAAEIERQLSDSLTARERSCLSIDPLAYARRVRCPALILQGGSDLHVPPRSAERLAGVMRAAGNHDVTVRLFPGISHAFLPDPGGLSSGWAALPGFMTSPQVLRTITDWADTHLRDRRPPARATRHRG
ncbi:MAG TPA: alpha/beta fold hydrolase, partial [Candidatus Eisenbacteria bacterium]